MFTLYGRAFNTANLMQALGDENNQNFCGDAQHTSIKMQTGEINPHNHYIHLSWFKSNIGFPCYSSSAKLFSGVVVM